MSIAFLVTTLIVVATPGTPGHVLPMLELSAVCMVVTLALGAKPALAAR